MTYEGASAPDPAVKEKARDILFGSRVPVMVDTSGYRERRVRHLTDLAHRSANKVRDAGCQILIGPFNAYERHIIHSAVQDDAQVTTKSLGEGDLKKILFKPNNLEDPPQNGD